MDLREFVEETLAEIIDGVRNAQQRARQIGAVVAPGETGTGNTELSTGRLVHMIEFDVAVTTTEESQKGAGLKVWVVSGGVQANTSSQSVSRIKFAVPVVYTDHQPSAS